MRIVSIPLLLAALTVSAAAQSSDSVTVNPLGGQVLIDPGTGQQRVVPPLLQPWQNEPVRLHPPGTHRVRRQTEARTATAPVASAVPSVAAETPPPPAPVVRKPRPARVAATPPAPPPAPPPARGTVQQIAPSGSLDDMGDLITQSQSKPASPPPQQTARVPPPRAATVEPPKPLPSKPATRTASIEKPSARISAGTRRDVITFAAGATDPSVAAVSAVRSLAGSLSAAMSAGSARVQLLAYGGARGEKSSDTRRLSLKRALVVRQLLIDDGVPSERIDVFALGGADDSGPLDRVDVYLKS